MGLISRLAFPDDQHAPAGPQERAFCLFVPFAITRKFLRPVFHSRHRHGPTFLASVPVPETPVDKNHLSPTRENKVRRPRKRAIIQLVSKPQPMHDSTDDHLRGGVPGFDRRHDKGTAECSRIYRGELNPGTPSLDLRTSMRGVGPRPFSGSKKLRPSS